MIYRQLAFFALLFSVFGISMAFAALSQDLTINGTALVTANGWSIHFANLEPAIKEGQTIEITQPVMSSSSTVITGFDVKFGATSDSITYIYDIANSGTLDAELSVIAFDTPTCTSEVPGNTVDEVNVCSNINYTLSYVGGALDGLPVDLGDTLMSLESRTVALKIEFSGTTVPINRVDVSNLGLSMIYTQI